MFPPVSDRVALFLDFDGTLVDLAPTPDGITVAPELPDLLARLVARTGGAVAVVSGRKVADIDRWLNVPLAAAGMHGLEHRATPGGPVEHRPVSPQMDVLRRRVNAFPFLGETVHVEDKGGGLAVHFRAAPERQGEVTAAMDHAVADLADLHLVAGKMVVEAKGRGIDKGAALVSFMSHAPFAGRTPVFIGDDVTDEDGIRAALAAGGFGIKVGEGDSAARYRLDGVPAVHDWLAAVADGAG